MDTGMKFNRMADAVLAGHRLTDDELLAVLAASPEALEELLLATGRVRRHHFGNAVRLCTICNGKSGRCSEDCRFCSQSAHGHAEVETYDILPVERLAEGAEFSTRHPIDRYAIVNSGRGPSEKELSHLAAAYASFPEKTAYCASLGILDEAGMQVLKDAGVSRYHHNLETAKSLFPEICTTHTYDERIATIRAAKAVGLSVCSGGIFGLGETDAQIVEMARTLETLAVDAVPVNFLVAIEGTAMEGRSELTPVKCLLIIATLRLALPGTRILICGGRARNLRSLQPLSFVAGATGLMTGDYLTTSGESVESDLSMLTDGGWEIVTG